MASERERNPRGQGNLLRGELLGAVDRLTGDEVRTKPKSLSLREVAREAGIAAPSIYTHFANKEELTEAAIDEGFRILIGAMQSAASEACLGRTEPMQVLAAQARAYLDFADAHRGFFRLMFSLGPLVEPEVGPSAGAVALKQQWVTAASGLRTHTSAPLTDDQLAVFIWNAVHGQIALSRALRPYESGRAEFEAFIDILIRDVVPLIS